MENEQMHEGHAHQEQMEFDRVIKLEDDIHPENQVL
jgi:uncharacterized protein YqfB (UPF0267 family)